MKWTSKQTAAEIRYGSEAQGSAVHDAGGDEMAVRVRDERGLVAARAESRGCHGRALARPERAPLPLDLERRRLAVRADELDALGGGLPDRQRARPAAVDGYDRLAGGQRHDVDVRGAGRGRRQHAAEYG